jgi:hypothetical protein
MQIKIDSKNTSFFFLEMPIEIKHQTIVAATEDYIVHQCCCTACKPHGLSATLAAAFPHSNIYALRKPIAPGRNFSRPEDRPTAGTAKILGNGSTERYVAALFGQVAMGTPGRYNACGLPDSAIDRQKYFKSALDDLSKQISLQEQTASLAFPYKIGCGLAGGDWGIYSKLLETWSLENPSLTIVLYRVD